MSLNVSGLSTYTDQNSIDLITKSVIGGVTSKYATIQTGIKSSATINILDTTLNIQTAGGGFTVGTNSTILSQKTINVYSYKINENIQPETLENYYIQEKMKAGNSGAEELPFEVLYTNKKVSDVSKTNEMIIWQSSTSSSTANLALSNYSLLNDITVARGAVNGNTGLGTVSSVTTSNIVNIVNNQVTKLYENIEDILDKDDLTMFVNYQYFQLYVAAMRNSVSNYFLNDVNLSNGELMIPGTSVKMVATVGLKGKNTIVTTWSHNIVIGTDLESDYEAMKIWYSDDNQEVRVVMKYKLGACAKFVDQCVLFTI